ncbi:MAG TPA: hypothetical protein VK163_09995 [Opitutaceae bacterium]|nr:hypothetical protein [Opitutaceae bacterium]
MRLRPLLGPLAAVAVTTCGWLRWRTAWSLVLLLVAVVLLALALFAPRLYAPIERRLTRFGQLVAIAFTWVVLGLLFFLLFTPVRLLLALFRRDPVQRRPDPRRTSYWEPLPPRPGPGHFRRQF